MRIAALQFDPRLGELKHNIARADELLEASNLKDVDLLVAPELALTGYNFPSLEAISDYLEPTCAGVTAWWAARVAQKYGLVVSIGYPEITTNPEVIPTNAEFKENSTLDEVIAASKSYVTSIKESRDSPPSYWTFNSSLTVGPNNNILAHYRKTHLYYTDATWASSSPTGFDSASITLPSQSSSITASFAICMDLNPKAFTAPWTNYEVATSMISSNSSLLIVNTAWMTSSKGSESDSSSPCCPPETAESPDMGSVMHWINRLIPLMKASTTTTVVIANRIGKEYGKDGYCDLDKLTRPFFHNEKHLMDEQKLEDGDDSSLQPKIPDFPGLPQSETSACAHYAGSSVMLTAGDGAVSVHGILGQGIEAVLIADTNDEAVLRYVIDPEAEE